MYTRASVDRASFSCIKARCIFRVFRLPQPLHSLSRLSIPSSATDPPIPPTSPLHHLNHSTCPFRIEMRDTLSALDVDARLIAASDSLKHRWNVMDVAGLNPLTKTKINRDGRSRVEEVEDRCFDREVCSRGKDGKLI